MLPPMKRDLDSLTAAIVAFRDDRDWAQFHNPKDLALSLVLEAGEVLEHMQWANGEALAQRLHERKEAVGEELSDVLYYTLLLAHDLGIDLSGAFAAKMAKNAQKYPVEKARGSSKKYTELD